MHCCSYYSENLLSIRELKIRKIKVWFTVTSVFLISSFYYVDLSFWPIPFSCFWGTPLTFLVRQTTGNTFFFRESHISFTNKRLFPRVQNSRLVCCFLSNCKYVTLFFLFAWFLRKVRCNFYLSFSLGEMFISSSFFKKILIPLIFYSW